MNREDAVIHIRNRRPIRVQVLVIMVLCPVDRVVCMVTCELMSHPEMCSMGWDGASVSQIIIIQGVGHFGGKETMITFS